MVCWVSKACINNCIRLSDIPTATPLRNDDLFLSLASVETESERQLGIRLQVKEEVRIGQAFTVTATITNKTDTTR